MHRDWSAYVSCLIISSAFGIGPAAYGQEPVPARNPLVPHVSASAAFDLRNGQSRYPAMYLGIAGLEWAVGAPGLAMRVEGIYARRGQDTRLYPQVCESTCDPGISTYSTSWSRVSAAGAFIGTRYELTRGRAIRPHITASVGAVRTNERAIRDTKIVCPACLVSADYITTPTRMTERTVRGAAEVGAGAAYRWRWISVVAEARYVAVASGTARGLDGAAPLALGVRF